MEEKFDYREWILCHHNNDYSIKEDHNNIKLVTDYGEATIAFTNIEEGIIVEFTIIAKKDDSVKFYLHFELNEEEHVKQLYDEMVETLINLKNEKTIKVLLSCSAGLTTAMFASNLNATAQMLGMDYSFEAVSYMSIYEEAQDYDVIMIAPQIGYMLKRLSTTITDKPVLQIPTAIFAAYDAIGAIQFVNEEMKKFNNHKEDEIKETCCCIKKDLRILAIAMLPNRAQTRIYYRLYDNGQIIDSHLIIKPSTNFSDFDDIINTILVKYQYIDIIGIAVPGIVNDNGILSYDNDKYNINLQQYMKDKYNIDTYTYNNANCAAVGFSLEHLEYKNILFYSQPFGYGVGGQGIIIDGKLVVGKNGIGGESKFFIHRMQLSDDIYKLQWSEQGVLELVTKTILPTISLLGPEVVAIRSPMTPDMNEIKKKLSSFIPDEYMPEFIYVKEASSYMLDGIMKLCIDKHEYN